MTFPSGGPGYPQQGGGAQPNPQPPGPGGFQAHHTPVATLSAANLTVLLSLAVTLLGLVNYFIGFSDEASPADSAITYLLIGGLLAALRVLPKGPRVLPFMAVACVLGGLEAIVAVVRAPAGSGGVVTVVLILGILQMLVAVATLLFDHGLLKLPVPQQPYGRHGQPYGQFNQPPQGPGEQKAGPAGTQFGPPVTPQSTVYAPQQGQFYQPPQTSQPSQPPQPPQPSQSSEPGPQQQQPPSGGGQQS